MALARAGACEAVVQALQQHMWLPDVAEQACGAICCFGARGDNQAALVDAGACEAILGALTKNMSELAVVERACAAVSLLSRSDERRVGKGVSVRVDLGGRRIIKKKQN